jgi:hypothetical protein
VCLDVVDAVGKAMGIDNYIHDNGLDDVTDDTATGNAREFVNGQFAGFVVHVSLLFRRGHPLIQDGRSIGAVRSVPFIGRVIRVTKANQATANFKPGRTAPNRRRTK